MSFVLWNTSKTRGVSAVSVLGYSAGEFGDIDTTTIEITFTEEIVSPGGDYDGGVTIKINAVSATILSSSRQDPDTTKVHYVIDTATDINDVVTWEYDDDFGDLEDSEGTALGDITAQATVNYVGSQYYFDTQESSMWLSASVL